jgi:hypothetical protein
VSNPTSFEAAVGKYIPYRPVSAQMVALKLGMGASASLNKMAGQLDGMPSTKSFSGQWSTPSGTPLGGTVNLTVNSNGSYTVEFVAFTHSHAPGLSFDFQVRAYLSAPGLPNCLFFYHAGSFGTNLFSTGQDDHRESGSNPLISLYWNQIVSSASLSIAKDYQWAGPVGTLEDLVKDLFEIGVGAVGTAIGAVIGLTQEAVGWLHLSLGPGGTFGVIAGVVVFAVAEIASFGVGTAVMLGTVAGVAVGAVASSMIQSRPMNAQEIQQAQQVFGSELPYQSVMLTNLAGINGRAFTMPGVDGKTYCNLGTYLGDTLGSANSAYPANGELLIHELTHAWQIAHNSFVPGFVCSGVVNGVNYVLGDDVYAYGPAGPAWSNFNLEQQAQIVNQWFAGKSHPSSQQGNWDAMATTGNPYYRYIQGNILTGSAAFSTSWL